MEQIFLLKPWILFLIVAWTLPWKGIALWKAVKNHHRGWFITMLVLNTVAILEIVYIFYFAKKSTKESANPQI